MITAVVKKREDISKLKGELMENNVDAMEVRKLVFFNLVCKRNLFFFFPLTFISINDLQSSQRIFYYFLS